MSKKIYVYPIDYRRFYYFSSKANLRKHCKNVAEDMQLKGKEKQEFIKEDMERAWEDSLDLAID